MEYNLITTPIDILAIFLWPVYAHFGGILIVYAH